jgi:serine/threonine protein kinase
MQVLDMTTNMTTCHTLVLTSSAMQVLDMTTNMTIYHTPVLTSSAMQVLDMTTNIGTPVYMAPELLSADSTAETIPAMVDVYSFGVLMWAIMTRERPFEKEMTEVLSLDDY